MTPPPIPQTTTSPTYQRNSPSRRRTLLVLTVLFGLALSSIAALLTISTVTGGEVSVLIGTLDTGQLIDLAVVVAMSCLGVALCVVPVRRLWLILLVPARLVAIGVACLGGFGALLLDADDTVAPVLSAGCETGYVVKERSFLLLASGTVYRQDGILVRSVERTSADDGYHPFADGAYSVADSGDFLQVWYAIEDSADGAVVLMSGKPDLVLPKQTDRTFSCGLETPGTRAARLPPTPTPGTPTLTEVEAGVTEMIRSSLAAAVGPVRDAEGDDIVPERVPTSLVDCAQNATEVTASLVLRTTDNAESLKRILAAWDAAGYASDRAIQVDIRYSKTLPVAKMSIRDSTTIDGDIRMELTSQCALND